MSHFAEAQTEADLPPWHQGIWDGDVNDEQENTMPNGVKEMELVPAGERALAEKPAPIVEIFERLARDKDMDVDKLDKLMQMYERQAARVAEEQFNAAMSTAQKAMRPIAADAENPQTRSKYASYGQLDRALRPIYTDHAFGVSYDTGDSSKEDYVRVLAYVTHGGGHSRTYHLDMPNDGKGAKGGDVMTKTHATGAAMSYGMRYLLKMIFNVAVGEDDRDGNTVKAIPPEPTGFAKWWEGINDVVPNGLAAYRSAWKTGKEEFHAYVRDYLSAVHDARKAKADAADKARQGGGQ